MRQLVLSLGVLTAVLICREYAFAMEADADPDHVEVEFGGRVIDDKTGKPIERFGLQWGLPFTAGSTEVGWGFAHSPRAHKGGKFHEKLGSGRGQIFALRILADGYLPQPVTPKPVTTPAKNTNLVVRLKRGFEVRGQVVDHAGKPVSKATVCLGGNQIVDVVDGELGHFAGSKTLTDDDGRFVLQGVDKAKKHNLVVSANSPHIWRADMPELGKEAKIALPQPATLKIRYQIPGTRDKTRFRLHMKTWEIERWKGVVESVQEIEIPNGGEVVLNKLAPGTYDLARVKTIDVGEFGQGVFCGRRDVTLEPGQSVEAGYVRSVGHPITGQVVGLAGAGVNGAFLFVKEAEATGNPRNRDEWKMDTVDAQAVDVEGHFKTEHLAPGTYTLVVHAYRPEDRNGPRNCGERLPDLIGSAKVTVEAKGSPKPVRIEMKTARARDVSVGVFPLTSVFAIDRGLGRDGTIRGKVIGFSTHRGRPVNCFVTLENEAWNDGGERPCLEVAPGDTFEFRNVPAGQYKVRAQPITDSKQDAVSVAKPTEVEVVVKNKEVVEILLPLDRRQPSAPRSKASAVGEAGLRTALAFVDVAEKLTEVRTATCKMYCRGTEGREDAKLLMAPGFTRFELSDGQVLIEDHRQRKCIRLNPDKRLANVWDMDNRIVIIDEQAWENPVQMLREEVRDAENRPDGEVADLGTRQIDGRTALGFRLKLKGKNQDTDETIWGDPKTGLPIRIERTITGPGASVDRSVFEDFEYNVELEDSLFDLEPPAGYTVQEVPPR